MNQGIPRWMNLWLNQWLDRRVNFWIRKYLGENEQINEHTEWRVHGMRWRVNRMGEGMTESTQAMDDASMNEFMNWSTYGKLMNGWMNEGINYSTNQRMYEGIIQYFSEIALLVFTPSPVCPSFPRKIPLIKRFSGGGTVIVDGSTIFASIIINQVLVFARLCLQQDFWAFDEAERAPSGNVRTVLAVWKNAAFLRRHEAVSVRCRVLGVRRRCKYVVGFLWVGFCTVVLCGIHNSLHTWCCHHECIYVFTCS